jgi:hypothetical protein
VEGVFMNKIFALVFAGFLCFAVLCCQDTDENKISDPMNVIPATGDDKTDAKTWEVPTPQPRREGIEIVYPLSYWGEEVVTRNKEEWEGWLQDPSREPLPNLHNDMDFVLTWCHQFAQFEPEEVGLILMNYFEYDYTYTHMQPTWSYTAYPQNVYVSWYELRRAIKDKILVCAGYSQLFYLIVREKYPDVKYIESDELCHARNYFEKEHWDITWLDEGGVDYNPDKIKFDFVGMQKRIARGINERVGSDWRIKNLVIGEWSW